MRNGIPSIDHRRTVIAACVALVALAMAAPAGAQQLRITGTITEVRPGTSGLEPDSARLREVCPGCVEGTMVTVAVEVPQIDCPPDTDCRVGGARLEAGVAPRGTITVSGTSWPLRNAGVLLVQPRPDRSELSVGGTGGEASTVGVGVDFWTVSRVFDAGGALLRGVDERISPSAAGGRPIGVLSVSGCPWEPESECFRPLGEVVFVVESVQTDGGTATAPTLLVVFVGGWGDAVVGGSMRRLEQRYRSELRQRSPASMQRTAYFQWHQQDEIEAAVREFLAANPDARVALVGHSMGGHTAYATAGALEGEAAVDLLVTFDPATRGGDRDVKRYPSDRDPPPAPVPPTPRPAGVGRWINVLPTGEARLLALNFCNYLLIYSGRWRSRAEADANPGEGMDHCSVDDMFDRVRCVRESLDALERGEAVAGPCRSERQDRGG